MKLFLQLFLLIAFTLSASAQHPKIVKARGLMRAGKSVKAYALLIKSYDKTHEIQFVHELIQLYSAGGEFDKAMQLAASVGLPQSHDLEDAIVYTKLMISQGDYQSAIDHCIDYSLRHDDAQPLHDLAYTCENLLVAEKKSILYDIVIAPFNDFTDEISISNYRRHYVISSNRLWEATDGIELGDRFDFYLIQKEYDKWKWPSTLLKDDDRKHNRTTLSYSFDGNFVYYTLSEYQPIKSKKKGLAPLPKFKLYSATGMGADWVDATPLPFQRDEINYKDPAIHPNGKWLVFASNLNGGEETDLFISRRTEEGWSDPTDLGDHVNSAANESMPYFDETGTLYFSSDRSPGFGGFDIYETSLDNDIWLKAKILPPPINSPYDDLSFIKHYTRPGGYLVSNRPRGNGGFDIYEFIEIDLQLGVTVLDLSNGSVVNGAEVHLMNDGILLDQKLTNADGLAQFRIGKNTEYDLVVLKDGYQQVESRLNSRAATQGRLLYWNIKLPVDQATIQIADPEDEKDVSFINFTAHIVDTQNKPISGLTVRMINSTTRKMKLIETNESGLIKQSLLLGNEYELVMEYKGERYVGVFSTIGLKDLSPKTARYTIGENLK